MLKRPSAVFLDWDGTLVDSYKFIHTAHNHVLKTLGMPSISLQEFDVYFGKPNHEIYAGIYGDKKEEAQKHFEEYINNYHIEGLEMAPGAEELLETLKALHIKTGVVSNKKGGFIRQEISHLNWEQYFISVVAGDDTDDPKPAATPLLLAVEQSGILDNDFNKIWYVGDSETDLLCAQNAGTAFVYVSNDSNPPPEVEKSRPALIVRNCTELQQFLLQCDEN